MAASDENGLPGARRLFRFRGHEAGVNEIAWSPDGETLASASDDAHICLWSASTGKLIRKLEGGGGAVISVDWTPDGGLLAAGFRGGSIRLWRGEGEAPCCMGAGKKVVNRVRWSPDGGVLASASSDSNIYLWRVEDDGLTLIRTLSGHKDAVMGLAWSPDGRMLASGSMDQTVLLWRVEEREPYQTLTGHGDSVTCLDWSPDGEALVSGSDDSTIRVRHPETGRPDQVLEDHAGFVREVRFSADGALLVSKSWDGSARLWLTDGWKPLGRMASGYNLLGGAAFHPQKPVLALLGESNNRIDVWEMSRERPPAVFPSEHGHMLLKSLWLTDVRCFENVHFPFETEDGAIRNWTLLLGENGCGKTTILRAAALLTAGREGFPDLVGEPDDWIRSGRDKCELQAELFDSGGRPFMVKLVIARGLKPQQILDKNQVSLKMVDKALGGLKNPYPTFGYGCSRRLSRQTPGPANEPRAFRTWPARNVATLFSPDALLYPLQKLAVDLDYEKPEYGDRILRNVLNALLPDMKYLRVDKEKRDVMFDTEDGEVGLSQLSDGYQVAAAWCGDLLYRLIRSPEPVSNPLQAHGLILIDEIDLHLHPVWQRKLRRFLKNTLPNFQILATTHSPLTAQQTDRGELFITRRPEPGRPPALSVYPGAPRRLLIQQLLTGPAFGVETVHEEEVAELRGRYRDLRDKPDRSPMEEAELDELRGQVASMSPPSSVFDQERKFAAALDKFTRALERGES